ncbi:MAG: tRNA (guanine(46)-N(7))-methyltransferase TrmB [Alphaproteobacteria bacterium]
MDTPRPPRKIYTTGRLASRMGLAERASITARLLPFAPQPADWQRFTGQIELEVGMGNGLALLERAKAAPNRLFIGVEVFLNGLKTLLEQLEANPHITNVRVVQQDARAYLSTIPAASISRLLVPYPDPWPKRDHYHRRIIQPEFLTAVSQTLAPAGEFWFISDIPDYMAWTQTRVAICAGLQEPLTSTTPPSWWVCTKYEAKAVREGRTPSYMVALSCLT